MISTTGRSFTTNRVHLPDLGRRGEGWVVLQVLLLVAILGAGFPGPLWAGPARVVGAIGGSTPRRMGRAPGDRGPFAPRQFLGKRLP